MFQCTQDGYGTRPGCLYQSQVDTGSGKIIRKNLLFGVRHWLIAHALSPLEARHTLDNTVFNVRLCEKPLSSPAPVMSTSTLDLPPCTSKP